MLRWIKWLLLASAFAFVFGGIVGCSNNVIRKNTRKDKAKTEGYLLEPLPMNPFAVIDAHAQKAPFFVAINIRTLAKYLQQKTTTDIEKARAVYVWIAYHIRYDDVAYNSKDYPSCAAEYVLRHRKTICEGFSNLFLQLAQEMGLEVKKVHGYAKGFSYKEGDGLGKENHAWNVVKIDGRWRIIDVTWGRGYGENIDGKLVSYREFEDYWFDADPYDAIFNHYATDTFFNLLDSPMSLSQYEQQPRLNRRYFELGFDGKELFLLVASNPSIELPQMYSPSTFIELRAAPNSKKLNRNKSYYFEFYIPRGFEVVMKVGSEGERINFEKERGKFSLNYTPTELGELIIIVRHENRPAVFEYLLRYDVY